MVIYYFASCEYIFFFYTITSPIQNQRSLVPTVLSHRYYYKRNFFVQDDKIEHHFRRACRKKERKRERSDKYNNSDLWGADYSGVGPDRRRQSSRRRVSAAKCIWTIAKFKNKLKFEGITRYHRWTTVLSRCRSSRYRSFSRLFSGLQHFN